VLIFPHGLAIQIFAAHHEEYFVDDLQRDLPLLSPPLPIYKIWLACYQHDSTHI